MRQGPHPKRGRGRGGNRRSGPPNRNHTFDSNGPDIRIRGNAHQVHEKYMNLAREAATSGEVVLAESYFQHAEHYYRILSAFTEDSNSENNRNRSNGNNQPGNNQGLATTNGSSISTDQTTEATSDPLLQKNSQEELSSTDYKSSVDNIQKSDKIENNESNLVNSSEVTQPPIPLRSHQRITSSDQDKIENSSGTEKNLGREILNFTDKSEKPVRPRRRPRISNKEKQEVADQGTLTIETDNEE